MWRSPMKICGTVRRPLRRIISVALFGLRLDVDFLEADALGAQQRARALAVRAPVVVYSTPAA